MRKCGMDKGNWKERKEGREGEKKERKWGGKDR